jgi:hypothetical protein
VALSAILPYHGFDLYDRYWQIGLIRSGAACLPLHPPPKRSGRAALNADRRELADAGDALKLNDTEDAVVGPLRSRASFKTPSIARATDSISGAQRQTRIEWSSTTPVPRVGSRA